MLSRPNVKAIFDYLAARLINRAAAENQLAALGIKQDLCQELTGRFLNGELSYTDIFTRLGV